jgi:hypothetical protein
LKNEDGDIVGIEVKSGGVVSGDDFKNIWILTHSKIKYIRSIKLK